MVHLSDLFRELFYAHAFVDGFRISLAYIYMDQHLYMLRLRKETSRLAMRLGYESAQMKTIPMEVNPSRQFINIYMYVEIIDKCFIFVTFLFHFLHVWGKRN